MLHRLIQNQPSAHHAQVSRGAKDSHGLGDSLIFRLTSAGDCVIFACAIEKYDSNNNPARAAEPALSLSKGLRPHCGSMLRVLFMQKDYNTSRKAPSISISERWFRFKDQFAERRARIKDSAINIRRAFQIARSEERRVGKECRSR